MSNWLTTEISKKILFSLIFVFWHDKKFYHFCHHFNDFVLFSFFQCFYQFLDNLLHLLIKFNLVIIFPKLSRRQIFLILINFSQFFQTPSLKNVFFKTFINKIKHLFWKSLIFNSIGQFHLNFIEMYLIVIEIIKVLIVLCCNYTQYIYTQRENIWLLRIILWMLSSMSELRE